MSILTTNDPSSHVTFGINTKRNSTSQPYDDKNDVFAKVKQLSPNELIDQIARYRAEVAILDKKIVKQEAEKEFLDLDVLRDLYETKFKAEQLLAIVQKIFQKQFKQFCKDDIQLASHGASPSIEEKYTEDEASYGDYCGVDHRESKSPSIRENLKSS